MFAAGRAVAAPTTDTPAVALAVTGECPARAAVEAALAPALGDAAAIPAPRADAPPPRVTDMGDRFEVAVGGQLALYIDAGRDCDERARIAAVFIALVLSPPTMPPRPPPAIVAAPPPERSAPSVARRWEAFSVAARCDGASAGSSPATIGLACGGALAAAVGKGAYGGFATAGLLAPTVAAYSSVDVREQRFPFALGARAQTSIARHWSIGADLGAALVLFTLRGQRLGAIAPATRLDVGARAAITLTLPTFIARCAPMLAAHVEYFPRPYDLDVDPLGVIGASSRLWLGASVGFAFLPRGE